MLKWYKEKERKKKICWDSSYSRQPFDNVFYTYFHLKAMFVFQFSIYHVFAIVHLFKLLEKIMKYTLIRYTLTQLLFSFTSWGTWQRPHRLPGYHQSTGQPWSSSRAFSGKGKEKHHGQCVMIWGAQKQKILPSEQRQTDKQTTQLRNPVQPNVPCHELCLWAAFPA